MADFCIHHFGQLTETESRLQKATAYRDLLRLKVLELPDDPMAWLQLGLQEYECSRESDEPMRCLERALALEPKATQAWLFKGMILLDGGNFTEALTALGNVGPGAGAALCEHLRGDALHNLGWFQDARSAYAQAAKLSGNDPVVISKLGYVEVRLGNIEPGLARLQRAAAAAPQLADVQERLMKAYVAVGRWTSAAEQAEKWAVVEATPKAYLRAVSIRVFLKQNDEARDILARGIDLFPDSPDLRRASSELGGFQSRR
jgi:tetratricopeptide (TPR) repeat protein